MIFVRVAIFEVRGDPTPEINITMKLWEGSKHSRATRSSTPSVDRIVGGNVPTLTNMPYSTSTTLFSIFRSENTVRNAGHTSARDPFEFDVHI